MWVPSRTSKLVPVIVLLLATSAARSAGLERDFEAARAGEFPNPPWLPVARRIANSNAVVPSTVIIKTTGSDGKPTQAAQIVDALGGNSGILLEVNTAEQMSFVVDFRLDQYGDAPGIRWAGIGFFQDGPANDLNNNPHVSIYSYSADNRFRLFVNNGGSPPYPDFFLGGPQLTLGAWYRIEFTVNTKTGLVNIRIFLGRTNKLFTSWSRVVARDWRSNSAQYDALVLQKGSDPKGSSTRGTVATIDNVKTEPLNRRSKSATIAKPDHADWPQWGGPNRDFTVADAKLADKWSPEGPPRLWRRDLGEGYSSIVASNDVLYTMYRQGQSPNEYTIALDANTGKTIWQSKHASPVPDDVKAHPGPHSTPLLSGSRLFSVGRNAVLRCFNKVDGRVLWERDLASQYGAKFSEWGYSPSPIAYGNAVILPVSRHRPKFDGVARPATDEDLKKTESLAEAGTIMAFAQDDGQLLWKSEDVGIDHSSPILTQFDGRDQLILLAPESMFAVAPDTGRLLWRHDFKQVVGLVATPIVVGKDQVFFSGLVAGSQLYQLSVTGGDTIPKRTWRTRNLRVFFSNPIVLGSFVIGSSGQNGSVLTCLDVRTGQRLWANRNIPRATIIRAGDKLIMLDENGQLILATADESGIVVHSRAVAAQRESYTPPTLVGTTLYVRDRRSIMAYDLGR